MPCPARLAAGLLLAGGLPTIAAQQPDSSRTLPDLRVTVTRATLTPGTAGLAVSLVDSASLHRGRSLPSLGDALAAVPGVVVRDRGDPSQDLRLTIRGAGARANFGVRSIRVIVDGVPATLPDGQTPLTAADLMLAERVEVARGPLAALHGNGSLGVVSIETASRPADGWRGLGGIQSGSDATTTWHAMVGGGGDRIGGLLAATGTTTDGWRAHAAARQLRLRGALEWQPAERSTVTVRASHADDPRLDSPGALTLAEVAADPRQANPNSLRRNAGKRLEQTMLSLRWQAEPAASLRLDLAGWVLGRDLENPIAAPAPAPADPDEGVWIGIDRRVAGMRASLATPLGPRLAVVAGVDAQRMVDDRRNRRHRAGEPYGDAFLDQEERITEHGAFVQLSAAAAPAITARGGMRHDRVRFGVADRLAPSAGGSRTLAAWSTSGSLAWQRGALETWIGAGSAFETPTTTELANRPDGGTGLNTELEPARTFSVELGVRHRGPVTRVEVVGWRAATRDAITAIAELGGRSFFANVGRTRTAGVELAAAARLTPHLEARASATWIDARFGDDAIGADGGSIAGHRLPGVAPFIARIGGTLRSGRLLIDIDHAMASGVWADDANATRIEGWGAGVTDAHLRWRAAPALALVAAVRNLFDVDHVAGVVVNGGVGRVAEPGRPRSVMVGGEIVLGR